jgi:hypothetical protein
VQKEPILVSFETGGDVKPRDEEYSFSFLCDGCAGLGDVLVHTAFG